MDDTVSAELPKTPAPGGWTYIRLLGHVEG